MKKMPMLLAGFFALALILSACAGGETPPDPAPKVTEIEIAGGPTEIEPGTFDPSAYTLRVTTDDGKTNDLSLTSDMLKADEVAALSTPGRHTLTVSYGGKTTTLTVTVKDPAPPVPAASHAVVVYLDQARGLLHVALIGDISAEYEKTAYAGFDIVLSYETGTPALVESADGVRSFVNAEQKFVRLVFASSANVSAASEVAVLSFDDASYSADKVSVKLYDGEQKELTVNVYYGNDYYPGN